MQQLSGLDASFLYLETGNTPMHIGSLAIYDQSEAPGGIVTFKSILEFFEKRLHCARVFRQRLANVPLSLDHPYWIEDPEFDLEFHVRHIALPNPGDWRQLCIQASRLHARPLDLNRPLWEAYVIEGLDNVEGVPKGSFAMVTKIHHAAIDGVSGAEMATAIHDLKPDTERPEPHSEWHPDRLPTGVELLSRTAVRTIQTPWNFAKFVARSAPSLAKAATGLVTSDLKLSTRVPRTRFNGNVSSHRVFDGVVFQLPEIKKIKEAHAGTTVNDVIVSVCGGALRKYLQSKNELPKDSLVAMAPISVRPNSQQKAAGNMVSLMALPVCSDIEDPVERLLAVHREASAAKKLSGTVGGSLGGEMAEFIPSTLANLAARTYARAGMSDRMKPVFNTVITNVPGVNVPLYSMGSELIKNFGLGPVYHGLGLFQPVIGYNNMISVSAISCREMMPDPAFYCDCLREAYAELRDATLNPPEKPRRKARKSKTKKKRAAPAGSAKRKSNGARQPRA